VEINKVSWRSSCWEIKKFASFSLLLSHFRVQLCSIYTSSFNSFSLYRLMTHGKQIMNDSD
jgi:hypothetical protein